MSLYRESCTPQTLGCGLLILQYVQNYRFQECAMEFAVANTKVWLFSVRISVLDFSQFSFNPSQAEKPSHTAKSVFVVMISASEGFKVYASVLHVSLMYPLLSKIGPCQKWFGYAILKDMKCVFCSQPTGLVEPVESSLANHFLTDLELFF